MGLKYRGEYRGAVAFRGREKWGGGGGALDWNGGREGAIRIENEELRMKNCCPDPSVGQPRAGVNLEIKRRETIPCTYTHMRISENPSAKMESWMPGGRGARGCMGEITWRGGRQNKELVGADNPDRMKP